MTLRIEQDHHRFREIIKGRIRKDLRRFLSREDLLGQEGGKAVAIPVYGLDLPTFRYGDNDEGVGMGQAGEGDAGQGQQGAGANTGGTEPGRHLVEVEVPLDELADILGEELKLPRIRPKGAHRVVTRRSRYTGVRPTGPESLRHFKRSYREALKRQLMLGEYDPDNPVVVPIRRDLRYRSWKEVKAPRSNALIVYMMDVSGSMGGEQKELVRLTAFWIDTWLRRNYEGVESRYIVHDVGAKEVDRQTFYTLREDGGTRISSAYVCCETLLRQRYDPQAWNIYLFHFSDGDNSSEADNRLCVKTLREKLLPLCNMFGYCQVASAYGSGAFINVLTEAFPGADKEGAEIDAPQRAAEERPLLLACRINKREDIMDALRTLFAPGR